VEVDNIDGWDGNPTGFPLTRGDDKAWLAQVANKAHALNMFIVWKNNDVLTSFGNRYFDGALSEQCYTIFTCTPAQDDGNEGCNLTTNPCGVTVFSSAGKWVGEVEYPPDSSSGSPGVCRPSQNCTGGEGSMFESYTTYCRTTWRLPPNGFGLSAWLADNSLDGKWFYTCWPATRGGAQ
jgi:hypothetical protein